MLGRVTLLNVAILSKIWYVASCTLLSPTFIKWLEKAIFQFIWNCKTERIKRITLIRPYADGGLGAAHVVSRCASFQVKHIHHIISRPTALWVPFAKYWAAKSLRQWDSDVWNILSPHAVRPNIYYRKSIKNYNFFRGLHPLPPDNDAIVKLVYSTISLNRSVPPLIFNKYDPVERGVLWKLISRLSLSPEARNFIWKVSHEIIAVKSFLKHRHILPDDVCPMCGVAPETISHCLIECRHSTPIIQLVQKIVPSLVGLSASSLIALDLPLCSGSQVEAPVIILTEAFLLVWTIRNDKVFNQKTIIDKVKLKLFEGRLRARIRADYSRLGETAFGALWLQGNIAINISCNSNKVEIIFPP